MNISKEKLKKSIMRSADKKPVIMTERAAHGLYYDRSLSLPQVRTLLYLSHLTKFKGHALVIVIKTLAKDMATSERGISMSLNALSEKGYILVIREEDTHFKIVVL